MLRHNSIRELFLLLAYVQSATCTETSEIFGLQIINLFGKRLLTRYWQKEISQENHIKGNTPMTVHENWEVRQNVHKTGTPMDCVEY